MKQSLKIVFAVLLFLTGVAIPSYSGLKGNALKVQSVEMGGLRAGNTVAFAYERFALVAPREPSIEVDEKTTPSELDNNLLYIVDTKNPKGDPESVSLGNCYYPTTVLFDPNSEIAFIRGTAIEDAGNGFFTSHEVIAYLKLHLRDDGKPDADSPITIISIPGRDGEGTTPDAPGDLVLSPDGNYLLFSNGVRLFSFNRVAGYVYQFDIISSKDYGPDSYISFAGFDDVTKTLVVSHNLIDRDQTHRTALRFYKLETENGVLPSLKFIEVPEFPSGVYLPEESNVAILPDDAGQAESAFFVTSDGELCEVDLGRDSDNGSLFGRIKQMARFDDLSEGDDGAGPRIVRIDPATRTVWAYRPGGVVLNIRRPVFNRPTKEGGIRRPVFVRSQESPVLVLAQLNSKRNKVTRVSVLNEMFSEDVSLSGLILQEGGVGVVSTYAGRVFSTAFASSSDEPDIGTIGEIGSRVDYVTYNAARESFVAISSSEDQEGDGPSEPSALIVAAKKEPRSAPVAALIASRRFSPLGGVITSIRRPCNLGR